MPWSSKKPRKLKLLSPTPPGPALPGTKTAPLQNPPTNGGAPLKAAKAQNANPVAIGAPTLKKQKAGMAQSSADQYAVTIAISQEIQEMKSLGEKEALREATNEKCRGEV